MNPMNNELEQILFKLIESKREGTYWDFKEEYHENKASLLHDILCLANAKHNGDRYLVFGISNPPICEFKGVAGDSNRKTQAQLIDFIRSKPFSGDNKPEIELKTLHVRGAEIDILIVFNHPQKPYYLQENYQDKGKIVNANSIYTRTLDTNTPINKSADISAITTMWRERFGLDLSPLEKVGVYLLEHENWRWDGIDTAYYKFFPEFTIKIGSSSQRNEKNDWWDLFPVGEPLTEANYELKYHSVILYKLKVIDCRREDFSFTYPDFEYIKTDNSKYKEAHNTYSFFHYVKGTLDYSLLHNLFDGNLTAIQSRTKPPMGRLPFIIFNNYDEKNTFTEILQSSIGEFFAEHPSFPQKSLGEKMLEEEKLFAEWAYSKWILFRGS